MSVKAGGTPVSANNMQQLLFVKRGADMTLTTDQAFTKVFAGSAYVVQSVACKRVTGAFGVVCAGGIYTGAGKTGDALVAAAQSWATLTGANTMTLATVAAIGTTAVETATPILALTTGNTGALTADFFIFGYCVD